MPRSTGRSSGPQQLEGAAPLSDTLSRVRMRPWVGAHPWIDEALESRSGVSALWQAAPACWTRRSAPGQTCRAAEPGSPRRPCSPTAASSGSRSGRAPGPPPAPGSLQHQNHLISASTAQNQLIIKTRKKGSTPGHNDRIQIQLKIYTFKNNSELEEN